MTDKEKIEYLSHDAMFGILTRPALELAMSLHKPVGATIFFLDITGLHKHNKAKGYLAVNTSLWHIFHEIQDTWPHLLIGRVFSGDEIAIVDSDCHRFFIDEIEPVFTLRDIEFRYLATKVELGLDTDHYRAILDSLINTLNFKYAV